MNYERLLEAIEFFGIREKISIRSLKRIYRNISKKFHPDRGGDIDEMRKANEFYRILMEYLETYEIPVTEEEIIRSSPTAFMYFQYYKKQDKDGRIGF
ncbi:MAG: molecular chaperone DnaJ [Brevinematia bacterium]